MAPDTPDLPGSGVGSSNKGDPRDALPAESTAPDTSTLADTPPPPVDAKSVLKIGLAAPVFALVFMAGVAGLISSAPDVAISIVLTAVGAVGIAACIAAWKTGGFSNLRTLRFATVASDVGMRVMRFLYDLGGVVMGIGGVVALICLLGILQEQPQVITARIALGAIAVGFLIQLLTGKARITQTGRILALKDSFKTNLDSAFTGLAQAQSTLEQIKQAVEADTRRLDDDLAENAQWELSIRGTDEDGQKRYRESVKRTNRKTIVATWAGVAAGVVLTELFSALGVGEMLKSILIH